MASRFSFLIALVICSSASVQSEESRNSIPSQPPFENSIVATEFDFITAKDPSAFAALRFLGRGEREMPDKRGDELFVKDCFLFEASFHDDSKVKIWAHNSFGDQVVAGRYAKMLSGPLGRLPGVMRKLLSHVVIHNGDETAFAESKAHFFVLYSKNMETRVRNHDLEETVFHETVHATLDEKHNQSKAWLAAQQSDDVFITEYAAKNPTKEDLPESALFAYTLLNHPGRLPSGVESWIRHRIPNRLAFFQQLFAARQTDVHAAADSLRTGGTSGPRRPNIIFIMADDLGFNQIGCYGDTPIKTPNLDRLAKQGIRFTQAYAGNTVCSPSRVSLFTGRDGRLMHDNSNKVQLRDIDVTIAHVLKRGGYDTALFGKYSIGSQMGVTDPLAMGFDTWYGMYSILEGHRQYPHFLWRDGKKLRIAANEGGKRGAYAQELFTTEAIKYISAEHTNPFFVLLAYSSPHAELAAPQRFIKPYEQRFKDVAYTGMSTGEPADKYAWYYPDAVSRPRATLAGMVTALDSYVGDIVSSLQQKGIADNTLIVFTSDNGPHDEGGGDPEFFKAAAPYKGMKRDLYDGGIHVPMIVSWPAEVSQGRVDDTPWTFADFLPTFAELAGVPLTSVPRVQTNGTSICSLLNDSPMPIPERLLYWEFGKQVGDPNSGVVGDIFQAARRGKWKAVRYGKEAPVQLFNLDEDPGEATNLSETHSELHAELVRLFQEQR